MRRPLLQLIRRLLKLIVISTYLSPFFVKKLIFFIQKARNFGFSVRMKFQFFGRARRCSGEVCRCWMCWTVFKWNTQLDAMSSFLSPFFLKKCMCPFIRVLGPTIHLDAKSISVFWTKSPANFLYLVILFIKTDTASRCETYGWTKCQIPSTNVPLRKNVCVLFPFRYATVIQLKHNAMMMMIGNQYPLSSNHCLL